MTAGEQVFRASLAMLYRGMAASIERDVQVWYRQGLFNSAVEAAKIARRVRRAADAEMRDQEPT